MKTRPLGLKEQEIMDFLHDRVFDNILASPNASAELKRGVRWTIMQLEERDAAGMIRYYWSAIIGTERSIGFAARMRQEGFTRFEEAIDEFRTRFDPVDFSGNSRSRPGRNVAARFGKPGGPTDG